MERSQLQLGAKLNSVFGFDPDPKQAHRNVAMVGEYAKVRCLTVRR